MKITKHISDLVYAIPVAAALMGCADKPAPVVVSSQNPVAQQVLVSDDGERVAISALNGTDLETYLHDNNGMRNISNDSEKDNEPQGFLGDSVLVESTDRSTGDRDLDVVDVNGNRVFSSNTPSEIERVLFTYGINKALVQVDTPVEGQRYNTPDHVAIFDAGTNTLTDLFPGEHSYAAYNNFGFTRRHVFLQSDGENGSELHVLDRQTGIVKQLLNDSRWYFVENMTGDIAAVESDGRLQLVNVLTNVVVEVPQMEDFELRFVGISPDTMRSVYEAENWQTRERRIMLFDHRTSALAEIAKDSDGVYHNVFGFSGNDGVLMQRSDNNSLESLLRFSIPSNASETVLASENYISAFLLADGTALVNYFDNASNRQVTAALDPVTGSLKDLVPDAYFSYVSSNGQPEQNSAVVVSQTDSGQQLAVYSPASGLRTVAKSGFLNREWINGMLSPTERYVVIQRDEWQSGIERLQLYDIATGETVDIDSITADKYGGTSLTALPFSSDETSLLYSRNLPNEAKEVFRFDIATGQRTFVSN